MCQLSDSLQPWKYQESKVFIHQNIRGTNYSYIKVELYQRFNNPIQGINYSYIKIPGLQNIPTINRTTTTMGTKYTKDIKISGLQHIHT